MGRFTREQMFEFVESACDLCESEKFVVVCAHKDYPKSIKVVANNRDDVFRICSERMIYGWDFAILPW